MRTKRPIAVAGGALLALSWLTGCVERTVRVQTDPPGALVVVNDEEVGVSPTQFSFVWYGDYEIILRKPGYRTLKTHHQLNPPWYQLPGIDLVAETLVPVMIRDEHHLPVYTLEPLEAPRVADVVERATDLREEALYGGD